MASMIPLWFLLLLLRAPISQAAPRTFNLTLESGIRAPDGFSRPVYLINGQQSGPLIEVDEGDDLEVLVLSKLPVETTIHWHGLLQRGTPQMDGVPGVTQYPIAPGGNFTYRFSLQSQYGFYWYHSHFRTNYNDAIRGPLMIHPSPARRRPFESLASNDSERRALLQAEHDAAPILLADWYHQLSDDVFAQYLQTGIFPYCVDSLLANGYGRVQCLPEEILQAGPGLVMPSVSALDGPATMTAVVSNPSRSTSSESSTSSRSISMVSSSMTSQSMKMTSTTVMSSSVVSPMAVGSMASDDMQMGGMTMEARALARNAGLRGLNQVNAIERRQMGGMPGMATDSPPSSSTLLSSMSGMSGISSISSMSDISSMSGMSGMSSMSGMSGMSNSSMGPLSPRGCTPLMMFRPGFNLSSLLPESCTNTSSPLLVIPADSSGGWLALNLVNGGAVSKLSVSLDGHSMYVYAADGLFVSMQEVQVLYISVGQRYSVMIKLNQPAGDYMLRFASYPSGDMQQVIAGQAIVSYKAKSSDWSLSSQATNPQLQYDQRSVWMLTNGSAKTNVSSINDAQLAPFDTSPPPRTPSGETKIFTINQTGIVSWVVNGSPYSEAKTPIVYGPSSDGWNASTTIHLPSNATVDIIMRIANDSMDLMGHPMHLHGHKFWLLGSGSGDFPYQTVGEAPPSMINLQNPPYRDTIDLPPSGWAVIRYLTDNPGAWLFHCHIQWHAVSGMGVVLVEGEAQFARMVSSTPKQTTSAASGTGICSMDFSCSPYIVNGIIIVMANIFGILAWSH